MGSWTQKPPAGTGIDATNTFGAYANAVIVFNEGTGNPTEIVGNNTTVPSGTETWLSDSAHGHGTYLAYSVSSSTSHGSVGNPATPFTVSLFIRSSDLGSASGSVYLSAGSFGGGGWYLQAQGSGQFKINVGSTPIASAAFLLQDNTWIHLIIVHTGSGIKFYADGAPDGSGTQACADSTSTTSPLVVNDYPAGGFSSAHDFDLIAIFGGIAFNDSQAAAYYANPWQIFQDASGPPTTATLTGPTSGSIDVTSSAFTVTLDQPAGVGGVVVSVTSTEYNDLFS